jgi:hypothetical protein
MRQHTQNLFKITNLTELDFSYRLVEIDLSSSLGNALYNTALQKVRQKIASKISGPAAILFQNGKHFIAIPAAKNIEEIKIRTSPFTVTAISRDQVYSLDWKNPNPQSFEVASRFLDFGIRSQLTDSKGLWSLNTYQFFLKNPLPNFNSQLVDVYGGFKYRLVNLADGNFYIVLDLSYKYLDKFYLPNYVNSQNCTSVLKAFKGRKCLYHNGSDWYQVEIVGFGKRISEHLVPFEENQRSVLDYIKSRNQNSRNQVLSLLSPDHLALLYKYPGRSMEPHHGATSLAKLVYNTNDQEARSLHKGSIKHPEKKFEYIQDNISRYFQNLSLNGVGINISTVPTTENERYFPMPDLKFKNDNVLHVSTRPSDDSTHISDFGRERKRMICDNGILNQSDFDNQYLIVPDKMDKELVKAFKQHAEGYLKKLSPHFNGFKLITYKSEPHLPATMQVQKLETRLREFNALDGYALFVLPDFQKQHNRFVSNFHDCLKNKFFPDLKFQCASATKIGSYYQSYTSKERLYEFRLLPEREQPFKSYLFNLVMEHLILNKKWPYSLAKNCNYDIYIGIDVHERYAGFVFFYKNGDQIFFDYERVPKKNAANRSEKLKKDLIKGKILPKLLSHIPKYVPNPNGIVIIRDGRSFGEEELALLEVLDELSSKNLIDKSTIKWGIIDLHKHSAIPFRIGAVNNGYQKLENPRSGSYRMFSESEGFLFNTAYPFEIRGTANPLHLVMQSGTADFKLIMQDIFHQSMLAFSAPDRSNSLPITIKLIDTFLEPLAYSFEDDIPEEDEIEVDGEETTTN